MTQVRVSASLPQNLVEQLKSWAEQQKVSQSAVLQSALELWLQQRLAQEADVLAALDFSDLPSEREWEALQSEI